MDDSERLSHQQLIDALRRWATGSYCTEAAVGLLIAHQRWLERADFRGQAISVEDGEVVSCDARIAGIDWDLAADLLQVAPASSSERQMLALVVALAAGRDHPVDLGNAFTSLDASNASRVLQALGHAAGLHERRITVVVDGHID